MAEDDFCWINEGQVVKWGTSLRPEGILWTGSIHRARCKHLGDRVVRLTRTQIDATGVQSCIDCGGDGKPISFERVPVELGCREWEREHGHPPHIWRDTIDGKRRHCPGWV